MLVHHIWPEKPYWLTVSEWAQCWASSTRRRTRDKESSLPNWATISPMTSISRLWLNHPFDIHTLITPPKHIFNSFYYMLYIDIYYFMPSDYLFIYFIFLGRPHHLITAKWALFDVYATHIKSTRLPHGPKFFHISYIINIYHMYHNLQFKTD